MRWIGPDPQLQRWLHAHRDVTQIVRMWPVRGPDDPRLLAQRIVSLHARFPWIQWFQIANEPDIEWASTSWQSIGDWTIDVWWHVERYRRTHPGASDIKLLFPPLAQGSPMNPEGVGYDALRPAIELYLDNGDGLAGHEYWDRGDVYLVEERWPTWLQARLEHVPFFVTEAGRRPLPSNAHPDAELGHELVDFCQPHAGARGCAVRAVEPRRNVGSVRFRRPPRHVPRSSVRLGRVGTVVSLRFRP